MKIVLSDYSGYKTWQKSKLIKSIVELDNKILALKSELESAVHTYKLLEDELRKKLTSGNE